MDNSVIDIASEVTQTPSEPIVQATEKMVPQSQVNEIVGSAKREAAERAVEAYKRQQVQSSSHSQQQSQEPISQRNISDDDIRRMTDDRIKSHFSELEHQAQERANVEAANRIVRMFGEKIVAGRGKYEDFDAVAKDVDMAEYPGVVQLLAEHVDNSADVLYHLAKNQYKLFEFEEFFGKKPTSAIREFKRLAESIKANDQTAYTKNANSPLSQQRPSNTGTDSGTSLSMTDLKRKYRA